MFFSLDGVDGTGKTTQQELFCDWLRAAGHDVVACRDPGGTELGEAIRDILLNSTSTPIHRRAEMLLYMASRAQLVEEVIRPALDSGRTVVSDRFLLANVVYQGHAGGLSVPDLWDVGRIATDGIEPDLTFLLDMTAEAASQRIRREKDRMEQQGLEYLAYVRQGYLDEAARRGDRIVVIDADRPVAEVQVDVQHAASQAMQKY